MPLTWELVQEVLIHSTKDAIAVLPLLFLAYLLMEAAEHHSSDRMEHALKRMGKAGPLVGALLGCVPQCGFSASASNLYAAGLISRGTLIAVFLSTSDEALPLMLGVREGRQMILPLLGAKIVIGIIAGFVIDLLMKRFGRERELHDLCEHCGCKEHGGVLRPALWHTVHILIFIFVVNFVLGMAMHLLGPDRISAILLNGSVLQPFAAALVGLIPNCAASVMLTQLFLAGSLSFGSLLAGLCSSAGVGLAVLLRMNRSRRENVQIVGTLYLIAVACGLVLQLVM